MMRERVSLTGKAKELKCESGDAEKCLMSPHSTACHYLHGAIVHETRSEV